MSLPARRNDADLLSATEALRDAGAVDVVSLRITRPQLTFDEYDALASYIGTLRDATAFWLGDLLLYGEAVFGERAYQVAADRTPATLAEYVRVAAKVSPSRRRVGLSWRHHQAVAALAPGDQDSLLTAAVEHRRTSDKLREQVRAESRARLAVEQSAADVAVELLEPVDAVARELVRAAVPDRDGMSRVPTSVLERLARSLGEPLDERPPLIDAPAKRKRPEWA